MKITRQHVARKLADYLDGKIPLAELVDWAESAMMDAEFPAEDAETIAQAAARLGLADVRAFGLTWEDCQEIFQALGLSAKIDLVAA
jgi:cobyrinic acid a,c-diamide synthase